MHSPRMAEAEHSNRERARRGRRPRALDVSFRVVGHTFVVLGVAYLVLRRADLPTFFPHARGASRADDANDVAMAAVMFMCAAFAFSVARYARRHRSWMRTQAWHRKHGRI